MLAPFRIAPRPGAWTADLWADAPEGTPSPSGPCRLCGDPNPPGLGWHHLDGDHSDWSPSNIVPVCAVCHGTQHLRRPTVAEEYALVWLPSLAQPEVCAAARAIHAAFHVAGESPAFGARPKADSPSLRAAWRAYRALAAGRDEAERIVGSAAPCMLGAALLGMRQPADALRGLRLLPLGRLYRGGEDVYPKLLEQA